MRFLSLSANSTSVSARYVEPGVINLRNRQINTDTGKTFFFTNVLSSCSDARINGYSNMYLSPLMFAEEVFEVNDVSKGYREVIPTYLVGNAPGKIIPESRYLFIDPPPDTSRPFITTYTLKLSSEITSDEDNRKFFEIELLDNNLARVMHKETDYTYYLAYNDAGTQFFFITGADLDSITVPGIDRNTFYYVIDRDSARIALFRQASGGSGISSFLAASGDKLTFSTAASSQTLAINTLNSFAIRYDNQTIQMKLNTGWAAYDTDGGLNNALIDTDRSLLNLKSNYFGSFQYSTISGNTVDMNILTLKNQESEKGHNQRSNYLQRNRLSPGVDVREYTSIFSGSNQEKGNDVITFNYEFYNADYVMRTDEYTLFKTPKNMYPYEYININDTYFALNGAIAGDAPYNSDKIWRRKTKSAAFDNDGEFLCTWLSGGDPDKLGIWVDRYYYPERTTFAEAISTATTTTNVYTVDSIISETANLSAEVDDIQFFDKKSDMVFEPDTEYIYQRIGNNYVADYLEALRPYQIVDGLTLTNKRNVDQTPDNPNVDQQEYVFNGSRRAIIDDYNPFNQSNSRYTFSFWMKSEDWSKQAGHQIIGNLNDHGFGVVNDPRVTPIITIHSGQTVYLYNSNFVPIHAVDIGTNIRHILRTDHLDFLFVIDDNNQLYKVKVNGPIVDRFDLSNEVAGYIQAIIDSAGNIDFLMNTSGTIKRFNVYTERLKTLNADQTTQIETRTITKDVSGTVRAFPGDKAINKTVDDVIFLVNDNLLVEENNDHTTRSLLISSVTNITDFTLDEENNVYVAHGADRVTKFNANRDKLYTVSLSGTSLSAIGGQVVAVDIVNEYTDEGQKRYPIVMSVDQTNKLHLTKIDETLLKPLSTAALGISGQYTGFITASAAKRYNLTNYRWLKDEYPETTNTLVFDTRLKTLQNNQDFLKANVRVDVSELPAGYHHFVYRFDGLAGNISVFIDNELKANTKISVGQYAMQTTVNDCIGVGATLFYNCELLSELLNQRGYYYISGITMKQVKFYAAALNDADIKFVHYNNVPMQDLVVSLPAGQRNALDEMKRLFKFAVPGHKSSGINVRVKNSQITNSTIQDRLKEVIKSEISKVAAADIVVNDVVFESF